MGDTPAPVPSRQQKPQGRKRSRDFRSNFDSRRGRTRRRSGQPKRQAQPKPPPACCCVCETQSPRYKCPKCRAPYCSVACCKQHKDNGCSAPQADKAAAGATATTTRSKYLPSGLLGGKKEPNLNNANQQQTVEEYDDLDEGWKITPDMTDAISKSAWLRQELKDGGLRQIIAEIVNCSRNATRHHQSEQEEALVGYQSRYPPFRTFVDKLLVVAGVLERKDANSEQENLQEWLTQSQQDGALGHLVLRSVVPAARHVVARETSSASSDELSSSEPESESSTSDSSSD